MGRENKVIKVQKYEKNRVQPYITLTVLVLTWTSQTSDANITSRAIRRTALVSFGFNSIVIALTISGLSGVI